MHSTMRTLIAATLVLASIARFASAGDLLDVLRDRRLGTADLSAALSAIGPPLSDAVASAYPVPSASSSVFFAWDPDADSFVEQSAVGSPIFGERAETIGQRQLNVTVTHSYVDLATINGDDLSSLENRAEIDGRSVARRTDPGHPFVLQDGRISTFVPVLVHLDLGVTAHVVSTALVYGVTPALDVGIVVPVVRSSLRAAVDVALPDPRFPEFALCPRRACASNPPRLQHGAASDAAEGVGDIVLRAKFAISRGTPADLAGILSVSLPTGNPRNFHGIGYTRVQPLLVASRYFGPRVQPYANVGMDLNTQDVGASAVRWVLGTNVQVFTPLTAGIAFLGRHELGAQSTVALPFFFQIERNDIVDASVGFRMRLGEHGSVAVNALVPLNDDGLRTVATPTVALEWVL